MGTARRHALVRHFVGALAALLAAAALLVPGPSSGQGTPAAAGVADSATYDVHLGQRDCGLLGRQFVTRRGCARATCTEGAVLWRKTYGAEACALRRAVKRGYGFVATVESRECRALQRRWIAEVNYCASEPDRSPRVIYDAPQCARPATVYVVLAETEGSYDECLTEARASELAELAMDSQTVLADQVALRSGTQCAHRPGHAFVNGICVANSQVQPSGGGVVMIGDSLTWRGSDELARLRPSFILDGEPARRPTELRTRAWCSNAPSTATPPG
jgi:hypothetical protein